MLKNLNLNSLIEFNQHFGEIVIKQMDYFLLEALSKFNIPIKKGCVEETISRNHEGTLNLKGFVINTEHLDRRISEIKFQKIKDYATYEYSLTCISVSNFIDTDDSLQEAIKYLVNKINSNPEFFEYMELLQDSYFTNHKRIIVKDQTYCKKFQELKSEMLNSNTNLKDLESVLEMISNYMVGKTICSEKDLNF